MRERIQASNNLRTSRQTISSESIKNVFEKVTRVDSVRVTEKQLRFIPKELDGQQVVTTNVRHQATGRGVKK
jgi:hypothetical protein